jgi:hypothetical protein
MVETIKKIATEAVGASNPVEIMFGKVTHTTPLRISVEQRLTLDEKHLILSSLVQDYQIDVTVDHYTENTIGGSGEASFELHNHAVKGKKTMTFHYGLRVGEIVILLRLQGGQKFIVLDRVR